MVTDRMREAGADSMRGRGYGINDAPDIVRRAAETVFESMIDVGGVTPGMVAAGVEAWEHFADSPPFILVEKVLQAALAAGWQDEEAV